MRFLVPDEFPQKTQPNILFNFNVSSDDERFSLNSPKTQKCTHLRTLFFLCAQNFSTKCILAYFVFVFSTKHAKQFLPSEQEVTTHSFAFFPRGLNSRSTVNRQWESQREALATFRSITKTKSLAPTSPQSTTVSPSHTHTHTRTQKRIARGQLDDY